MDEENKISPWGTLTNVNPVRLARKLVDEGQDPIFLKEKFEKDYSVRKDKAQLVQDIFRNQVEVIRNDNIADIYVNIPICPSRCNYCSFISSEEKSIKQIISTYVDCLVKEIRALREIISQKPYIVKTIYIGGGTPTVLSASQLEKILMDLSYQTKEFTVECGRPETITREKLQVLKNAGVTRICINPQTFSQPTLKKIGRNHTVMDIVNAYKLALEFGFDVNMDLIAGLENETLRIFKNSIKTLLEMSPSNITIHTLASKKGSLLQGKTLENPDTEKMVEYAYKALTEAGYKPYYMYRQKHQIGDLENVGYAMPNKNCVYNIDSMEETNSILACGAHGISKKVLHFDQKITRYPNTKFIWDYIENIEEIIKNKKTFFLEK